jgi:hypothetical protein
VTQKIEALKARRAKVRARLKKRGILQEHIAAAAKCDRTLVVHYFAGRRSPESVERAIRELLAAGRSAAA